jgi:hypothetical protein
MLNSIQGLPGTGQAVEPRSAPETPALLAGSCLLSAAQVGFLDTPGGQLPGQALPACLGPSGCHPHSQGGEEHHSVATVKLG